MLSRRRTREYHWKDCLMLNQWCFYFYSTYLTYEWKLYLQHIQLFTCISTPAIDYNLVEWYIKRKDFLSKVNLVGIIVYNRTQWSRNPLVEVNILCQSDVVNQPSSAGCLSGSLRRPCSHIPCFLPLFRLVVLSILLCVSNICKY